MTLEQFKKDYYCTFDDRKIGDSKRVITSTAVHRGNNKVVDSVKTTIDIQETSQWIADSQTAISLTPWTWDDVIEKTKRSHLDHFALRAPIDDFYPLNSSADISDLYN